MSSSGIISDSTGHLIYVIFIIFFITGIISVFLSYLTYRKMDFFDFFVVKLGPFVMGLDIFVIFFFLTFSLIGYILYKFYMEGL